LKICGQTAEEHRGGAERSFGKSCGGLSGEGFESGGLGSWGGDGAPGFETSTDFIFKRGPGDFEKAFGRIAEGEESIRRGFVGRAREEVQFVASACGGDVEETARLLLFAIGSGAIDKLFSGTAAGALGLEGGNQKLGDFACGFVKLVEIGTRRETALEPGEHGGSCAARDGLKVRHDDHLEFEALRFVDGHQLNGAVAGAGLGGEHGKGGIERGAEEIGLALRKAVERAPEEFEIDAGCGVDALWPAEMHPDLLKPGSRRSGWIDGAKASGEIDSAKDAIDAETAIAG